MGSVAATERLDLRMTPDQRAAWLALAETKGVSLAELVRAAVEHYAQQEDQLADLGRDVLASVRRRFPERRGGR